MKIGSLTVRVQNYKGTGMFYPEWRSWYLIGFIWLPFYTKREIIWFKSENAAWDWLETANIKAHKHEQNNRSTYSYKREGK